MSQTKHWGFFSLCGCDGDPYLLIRQHRVALQGLQVTAQQGPTGTVMLTKDGAIHIVEAITGHESISARSTGETLEQTAQALTPIHEK